VIDLHHAEVRVFLAVAGGFVDGAEAIGWRGRHADAVAVQVVPWGDLPVQAQRRSVAGRWFHAQGERRLGREEVVGGVCGAGEQAGQQQRRPEGTDAMGKKRRHDGGPQEGSVGHR